MTLFDFCKFLKSRFQYSGCNLQVCGGVQLAVQECVATCCFVIELRNTFFTMVSTQLLFNGSLDQARNQDFAKRERGGLNQKSRFFHLKNGSIERRAEQIGAIKRRFGLQSLQPLSHRRSLDF